MEGKTFSKLIFLLAIVVVKARFACNDDEGTNGPKYEYRRQQQHQQYKRKKNKTTTKKLKFESIVQFCAGRRVLMLDTSIYRK